MRGDLLKSLNSVFFKGLAAISSLALTFLVARFYAENVASHVFVLLTALNLSSILIRFGSDSLIIRLVANKLRYPRTYLCFSSAVYKLAAIVWLLGFVVFCIGNELVLQRSFLEVLLLTFLLFLYSLFQLNSYFHQAEGNYILHSVYLNTLFSILVIVIHLFSFSYLTFDISTFLLICLVSAAITLLVSFFGIGTFSKLLAPSKKLTLLFKLNFNYMSFALVQNLLIWAPQILLYFSPSSSEVTSYTLLQRISLVLGFVLIAITSVYNPKIAKDFKDGNIALLEKRCGQFIIMYTGISVFASIFLLATVSYLFEFLNLIEKLNYFALSILFVSQLVNCATGPSLRLLLLSGKFEYARKIQFYVLFAIVLAGTLLSDYNTVVFACILSSASIVFTNIYYAYLVNTTLKVNIYRRLLNFK